MAWIKSVVKEIVAKYKTNDPYELASFLKIQVKPWDLHPEINGFYKYYKRNRFIFLNNNLTPEKQRFVCAHELGHAILHPRANTPFLREKTFFSIDKIEVEANTFAIELLLQDETIYEYQDTKLSIHEIAEIYGVPKDLAHLKKFH